MLKFKKVEKFSEVFHKLVSKNINWVIGDNTEGLHVCSWGYQVVSTDGDNVGYIFKIQRPPLSKKRHSYYKHSMGFYQDYGYFFTGNILNSMFKQRKKDLEEMIKEEYKKYE